MGIFTKTIKLAIPFGFLHHVTINLELFNVSVGSEEAEKRLLCHKSKLDSYTKLISDKLASYDIKLPENTFNYPIRQYYNCAVYTTFHTLANFNAINLINKSVKSISDLFENQTKSTDKSVDKIDN